jgi:hypothetical protein
MPAIAPALARGLAETASFNQATFVKGALSTSAAALV